MQFTLRQARTHAGMTQAEMAKILGIDRGTYLKIEKDVSRATVGQVHKISDITGVPLSDIILASDSTLVENQEGGAA